MSIDNLFVPNIYDLFARSITITGGSTGPITEVASGRKEFYTSAIALVGGDQTITGYTVQGVAGSLPAHLDNLGICIITAPPPAGVTGEFAMIQITLTVPQFEITSVSGATPPNAISFQIPPQYAPLFATSYVAFITTTGTTSGLAEIIVFTNGTAYINLPAGVFNPAPYGLKYDLNITYSI